MVRVAEEEEGDETSSLANRRVKVSIGRAIAARGMVTFVEEERPERLIEAEEGT